jgi:hypothetical protein
MQRPLPLKITSKTRLPGCKETAEAPTFKNDLKQGSLDVQKMHRPLPLKMT